MSFNNGVLIELTVNYIKLFLFLTSFLLFNPKLNAQNILKNFSRYKFQKGNLIHSDSVHLKIGVAINAGWGENYPIGKYSQKLSRGSVFNGGLLVRILEKRIQLSLMAYDIYATIKDSLNYGIGFIPNNKLSTSIFEIKAGYEIYRWKTLTVIPLLGIGAIKYNSRDTSCCTILDQIKSFPSISFNLAIDFLRLNIFKTDYININFRTLCNYQPLVFRKPFDLTGGCFNWSLGFYLGVLK